MSTRIISLAVPSLLLFAPMGGGCDGGRYVPTVGLDLSDAFPQREEWFWRYNNDDFVEEAYWWGRGASAPAGEDWSTFRLWVNLPQTIVTDFAGDEQGWDVDLFFADRPDGWYFMGWQANLDGPSPGLSSELMSGNGVPFAMTDVTTGRQWTAEVNERSWTTTATEESETLAFNGQQLEGLWRIDVESDTGDVPFEGSFWLSQGPGIVQWNVPAWREEGGLPWQHLHNAPWDERMGVSRR